MKIICIHHRLGGFSSHHFNESYGLRREFESRGREFILLVNRHAPGPIVSQLEARAVMDDPTFRMEWSFEERSRRFVDMLHKQADRIVRHDDCVLVTISTQLEAHALTVWLQELPVRKKPWIVILFLSDRWNRTTRDEYERQAGEFRKLASTIATMPAGDANKVVLLGVTEALAAELTELLGTPVAYAPMPLLYADVPLPRLAPVTRPRVSILGGLRREKGSYLIPEIIRASRVHVDVEFLVHLTNNTLAAEDLNALARLGDEPDVTVIPEALPWPEYTAAVQSADIGLFPYEVIPYRKRSSGVFADSVAMGKPVVVTPGTWMAEQIKAGRAAGVIADDFSPESFARAIERCIDDLPALRRSAQELISEWRRTVSIPAFVDQMESQIAERRTREKPPRRRFLFW